MSFLCKAQEITINPDNAEAETLQTLKQLPQLPH